MRWYNEYSEQFLQDGYLLPGQTVEDRVRTIAEAAEEILKIPGYAKKLYDYVSRGWISFSTPVWTNFGTNRGLPISCFGSYIEDTSASILYNVAEIGMMTKHGGGTSAVFSELRPRGSEIKGNGTTSGAVHFHVPFNATIDTFSQGATRRGNFATYLRIDHGDIMEFLTIKGEKSDLQSIFFGVVIPAGWMESMKAGDRDKRRVWAKVLETRIRVGMPYLLFQDNAMAGAPDVYRDLDLTIHQSNLCTEIMLPNTPLESFVCDLSSVNIRYYDEWKGTDLVEMVVQLLDANMTEFITKAREIEFMQRAVRFAERHRALGLGWLGWHDYLQNKSIPFEGMTAKLENAKIAKQIYNDAYRASTNLANLFGEPELLKGYGRRNTTLMAIAPTKSSSFILGQTSEGIEPIHDNYYLKDLAKGTYPFKNRALEALLDSKGENTRTVWDSIGDNKGSVQHLTSILTEHERDVFKTFKQISPMEIIQQAAQRQKWIDQGQSVNVFVHPSTPVKDINHLYVTAHELGVKSLYYQKGNNAAKELAYDILHCKSCE